MGLDIVNPPPAFLFIPTIIVFDASTTWIVPPGVSKIYAQLWGGGGSGGASGAGPAGGNGGGGEYQGGTTTTLPGESIAINVGLGGAGTTTQPQDGNPGGSTNIKRGGTTLLEAKGGGAGTSGGVQGAGGTGGTGTEGIDGASGFNSANSPKGGWGGQTPQVPGGGSFGRGGANNSNPGAHGRIVIMYWQPG